MTKQQKTTAFRVGDRVATSGFPGTIVNVYEAPQGISSGLYDVRLARGTCCVAGSELALIETKGA